MLSTRDVPSAAAELIPYLKQINAQAYCQLSASALIFYDHLALLGYEFEYMWSRNLTAVSILFLVNRYTLLASAVLGGLSVLDWTDKLSCEWLYDLQYALTLILIFALAWFSAIRTFAVSHRTWWPAAMSLGTAVVAIPVYLFADIRSSRAYVTYVGHIPICAKASLFSSALNTRLIFAIRITSMVSDLIVLCCTWYFTGLSLDRRKSGGRLARLLLQQGIIYFISLLVLNVVQIVVETALGTQTVNIIYTATFTGPISSMLIARFMLDLRAADKSVVDSTSRFTSTIYDDDSGTAVELSTINFSGEASHATEG